MKVIIAGSRHIADLALLNEVMAAVLETGMEITEVVSGGAPGVDTLGETWAREHHIPVRRFPADWHQHGRAAGPIRNAEMARYADWAVLLWDGKSAGTRNMLTTMAAQHHGRPAVHLCTWDGRQWKRSPRTLTAPVGGY